MPPIFQTILMLVVFGAIMYFLMIRPQQKRMREHQEMLDQLQPGARVVLTSGLFGTLLHSGDKQMIVEIAPGVEITVVKGHVARVAQADEEEFEYEDEQAVVEAPDPEVPDPEVQPVVSGEEPREMLEAPAESTDDQPRGDR